MHKLLQNKRLIGTTSIVVVLLVVAGVFGFRSIASAGIFDFFGNAAAEGTALVLGGFIALLVQLIGGLVVNLMYMVLAVAQYNQFLASTAVSYGWVVVRDVVNMGFVVVLLAIAIGTILQQQQYNYSQTLPKFLAAAILVNFSKTICGLFIDAAQIVMMTFVGAFSQAGGGNFAVLIGLNRLLTLTVFGSDEVRYDGLAALSGLVLALIFVSLALIVIGVMVAILVIRIIALWFLIILSPAAFFLMSLPNDRGYASKWWDQFINYLLVGPVMAFFLWLSFTIVSVAQGTINDSNDIYIATELGVHFEDRKWLATQIQQGATSGLSTLGGMAGYILGIGLLMGSLMAAQQLSSVGGSIAGGALSGFKDYMQGKRGPFNPIRTAREVGSGLAGRWEKRRKERVERLTDRVQGAIGVVSTVGRATGQRLYRGAMQTEAGQAVARGYRQVEQGLDRAIQVSTGALTGGHFELGFGRDFRGRIEEQKRTAAGEADTNRHASGTLRADVIQRQNMVHADKLERDDLRQQALAARAAGQIPLATTLENTATARQTRIDLNNQVIEQHNASANDHDNLAQAADTRALFATLRKGFAGFFGASLRTAALGWTGAGAAALGGAAAGALPGNLMAAAVVGPSQINRLGRWGEVQNVEANEAQAHAVDANAKKHSGKSNDEVRDMLSEVKPGYNQTPEERMGLIKHLLENEGFREQEMPSVRRMMYGEGANQGTIDSIEPIIESKYPTQALRPMDPGRRQELLRRGVLKPESATVEFITDDLIDDLMDPTVRKMGDWIKNSPATVRNRLQELLRLRLTAMQAPAAVAAGGPAAPVTRNAAGDVTGLNEGYGRFLSNYANSGGDMNELLALNADGSAGAGHTGFHGAILDGITRDSRYSQSLLGFSPGALSNPGGEILTRVPEMAHDAFSKLQSDGPDGFADKSGASTRAKAFAGAVINMPQPAAAVALAAAAAAATAAVAAANANVSATATVAATTNANSAAVAANPTSTAADIAAAAAAATTAAADAVAAAAAATAAHTASVAATAAANQANAHLNNLQDTARRAMGKG